MAILSPAVAAILRGTLSGNSIFGISSTQLALGIANGFSQYVLSTPVVTTADVGSLGAGAGVGFGLTVPLPQFVAALQATMTANGINGPMRTPLVNAVTQGLSQALLAAQIVTTHAGTAVGTGTVVGIATFPATSVPLMITGFAGAGIVGVSSAGLATAIAQAVDQILPSAKGQVVIAGPSSPLPGGGAGIGKIL